MTQADEPTLYEWAGGSEVLVRMLRIFYGSYVPADPLLAPLFAHMSPDHPERVGAWLGEVFGGPPTYSERYGGYPHMIAEHAGRRIGPEARRRWVELIIHAADDAGVPDDPEFRSALLGYLEWGSRLAVENSRTDAKPPANMPMPHWDWGTAGPPGRRLSALAHRDGQPPEEPATLPAPGEPVGFDRHVRTFFRDLDRRSMRGSFDLGSYDDVRAHAAAILDRVRAGSMPCDGPWPADRVDALARWVDTGMPR
jgi:truncated hemoglobin YjbI